MSHHHHAPGFLSIVEEARKNVRETNIRQVKDWLDVGRPFILVDTREESEFARGCLPGAVHLSKGVIERDVENPIPDKQAHIVLYCGGGYRSALAAESLQKMGYAKVESMDGGWRAWTGAGFPTE
jgi:rhodanese-related sulfurtransferase